jgi:phenylacetate-CoA ligase
MTIDGFGDFAALRQRVQEQMAARLPDHVARMRLGADALAARQRDGLRTLLRHAVAHSPFHARRLAGIDVDRLELADLARLPVMTKADLMDRFDDVVTDRRLTRALCERALAATGTEPRPLFGEYTCLASGGSSGRRGVFVLDAEAKTEFLCVLHRPAVAHAIAHGGPPPAGMVMAMVAAASAVHATGASAAWMDGGPVRIAPVPATLPLEDVVARLEQIDPPVLIGYPSMLIRVAREKAAGRLAIAPEVVRSTSETLLPEWRREIESAFGVGVSDVFGSSEGLIGVAAPGDPVLTFNTDVCIVELVDEDDRPVPRGVPSAKILVTNLANRVQPLVRYEIGDRFVRMPDAREHGHLRATVEGRNDDGLRWDGIEVHPLVVRGVMVKEPRVTDYQVRQTARGIDVALLATEPFALEPLCTALRGALQEAGIRDPEVGARHVAALERNPETGKVRRFIAR